MREVESVVFFNKKGVESMTNEFEFEICKFHSFIIEMMKRNKDNPMFIEAEADWTRELKEKTDKKIGLKTVTEQVYLSLSERTYEKVYWQLNGSLHSVYSPSFDVIKTKERYKMYIINGHTIEDLKKAYKTIRQMGFKYKCEELELIIKFSTNDRVIRAYECMLFLDFVLNVLSRNEIIKNIEGDDLHHKSGSFFR